MNALVFDLALIPLSFLYAAYYASYHHFGMTELAVNFMGNRLTLESAVYGLVTGMIIAGVMIYQNYKNVNVQFKRRRCSILATKVFNFAGLRCSKAPPYAPEIEAV